MPEPTDSSLSRRGAWIGLRTLRQRPKIVDHTRSGDPIFEVRSVQLLLRPDADHFNRLQHCSKCGRDVPGAPVHELADLDRPANPLICQSCVRSVASSTSLRPEVRRPAPVPVATVPRAQGDVDEGRADPPAAVDSESNPGAGHPTEAIERAPALDDEAREQLRAVTEMLQAQQRELSALSAAVEGTRTELQAAQESYRSVARAQQALEQRIVELAGQVAGQADAGRVESLERRIEAVGAGLGEGLSQARAEAADVAAGIHQQVDGFAGAVESRIQEGMTGELEAVARSVGEMRASAGATDGRLQALEQRIDALAEQVASLVDSRPKARAAAGMGPACEESAGSNLLDGLERQLRDAEGRLSQRR